MRITQRKGDIAVTQAISTFTRLGYDVSLPITESASYDLIVDFEGHLKKVQVKFTTLGEVDLRRVHSNAQGYVVKKPKTGAYDWLYILKSDGVEFLIHEPTFGGRSITPGAEHRIMNSLNAAKEKGAIVSTSNLDLTGILKT